MQTRACGKGLGASGAESPRPGPSDRREHRRASTRGREGGPGCAVWGSSLRYPYCHPLPRLSGTRENGLEVPASVYLSKGNGGVGGRGPPRSPSRHADVPFGGQGHPACGPGRCGAEAPGAARQRTKAGSGSLHMCAAAAGPGGSAVRREGPAAPLLPGLSGRETGSLRAGVPARPPPRDEASGRGLPAGRPCPAPPPKGHRGWSSFSLRATLAERPFTAPGLQRGPG